MPEFESNAVLANRIAELQRENSKLQQERNELAAERDALSQKLRAAQHEAEALAATVDRMSTFIKLSAKKWEGVPEVEPTFWNLLRVANESSQQHLRDVEAEAGRAGFIAGRKRNHAYFTLSESDAADQYAESVKAGGK